MQCAPRQLSGGERSVGPLLNEKRKPGGPGGIESNAARGQGNRMPPGLGFKRREGRTEGSSFGSALGGCLKVALGGEMVLELTAGDMVA